MAESHFPALRPADFHILLALSEKPCHGYGIMKTVEEESGGDVRLEIGSLYRLLARLLDDGWIAEGDSDGRRREYQIARLGRRMLKAESARLASVENLARSRGFLPEEG